MPTLLGRGPFNVEIFVFLRPPTALHNIEGRFSLPTCFEVNIAVGCSIFWARQVSSGMSLLGVAARVGSTPGAPPDSLLFDIAVFVTSYEFVRLLGQHNSKRGSHEHAARAPDA